MPHPAVGDLASAVAVTPRWVARLRPAGRSTVLSIGTVSSGVIAAASYVVGDVGRTSGLWDVALFRTVHGSPVMAALAGVGLVGSTLGLVVAWLLLGRLLAGRPADGVRTVVTAAVAWSLPLVIALPLFSKDVFAYVGQGRLMDHGIDPYRAGIGTIPGWWSLGVDPLWATTPTPYGPVWLLIEQGIVGALLPVSYLAVLLAFRLVAVGGIALTGYSSWRLSRSTGRDPARVLWIVSASPLVLLVLILGAHNDALMIGLVLAGMSAAGARRPGWALTFVTLAVGVKPVALVALPVIGLVHVGLHADWHRTIRYWSASIATCLAGLGALGAILGVGVQWLWSMATPSVITTWFAPTSVLAATLRALADGLGLNGDAAFSATKTLGMVVAIGLGCWVLVTRRSLPPLTRLTLAFGVVIALSPVIHPWYVTWGLCFAAVAGLIEGRRAVLITTCGTVFLLLQCLLAVRYHDASGVPTGVAALLDASAVAGAVVLCWAAWAWSRQRALPQEPLATADEAAARSDDALTGVPTADGTPAAGRLRHPPTRLPATADE